MKVLYRETKYISRFVVPTSDFLYLESLSFEMVGHLASHIRASAQHSPYNSCYNAYIEKQSVSVDLSYPVYPTKVLSDFWYREPLSFWKVRHFAIRIVTSHMRQHNTILMTPPIMIQQRNKVYQSIVRTRFGLRESAVICSISTAPVTWPSGKNTWSGRLILVVNS